MRIILLAALCCTCVSAGDGYRLKLSSYLPAGTTEYGLVLKVSLDGGKPLRLVFDTGASGITVSAKAAHRLDLPGTALLNGFGSLNPRKARVGVVGAVDIDGLRIENCPVQVVESNFAPGADGVIGADVFRDYRIRLDAWSHTLDLLPPGDEAQPIESVRIGHLLAIRTTVEQSTEGLFVIDTGAAHTTIAPELLSGTRQIAMNSFKGAQGTQGTLGTASNVHLYIAGGPALTVPSVLALDLSAMSKNEGARISGLLGYSTLSKMILTLDYRHNRVGLDRR